jgi:hypothetical protein
MRSGTASPDRASRPRRPDRGRAAAAPAGPRLTTVIAYLKGACHASYSTIRKFVRDVIGLTISRGQLAKIVGKVSRALERPYEELLCDLPCPFGRREKPVRPLPGWPGSQRAFVCVP